MTTTDELLAISEEIRQIAERHGGVTSVGAQADLCAMLHRQRQAYAADTRDARRYRYLRSRDIDAVYRGGVFAGQTPENRVLSGTGLDVAIDVAITVEQDQEPRS